MDDQKAQTSPQNQAKQSAKSEKVTCYVSKRQVDRSTARQISHPKEGLVWVAKQYIK